MAVYYVRIELVQPMQYRMNRVMSRLWKVFDLVTAAKLTLKITRASRRTRAPMFMNDSYAHENIVSLDE